MWYLTWLYLLGWNGNEVGWERKKKEGEEVGGGNI
jgi:hypothetical protein